VAPPPLRSPLKMHAPKPARIADDGFAATGMSAGEVRPQGVSHVEIHRPPWDQGVRPKVRGLAAAGTEQAADGCPHVGGQSEDEADGQRPEG